MGLAVLVVLVALVLGLLAGGSLARLGALPLRDRRLVALAVLAQLGGAVGGGPLHALGLAVSTGLVIAFLVRNRGVRGTGLVALGLAANALVVGLNGAMPVSADAAARAGVGTQQLVARSDPRHVLAGPQTRLSWLGDVVPVPLPLRPEVVSPGDVLVAAGLGQLVVAGMLRPRPAGRQRPQRRALPPVPAGAVSRSAARRPVRTPPMPAPARRPRAAARRGDRS